MCVSEQSDPIRSNDPRSKGGRTDVCLCVCIHKRRDGIISEFVSDVGMVAVVRNNDDDGGGDEGDVLFW